MEGSGCPGNLELAVTRKILIGLGVLWLLYMVANHSNDLAVIVLWVWSVGGDLFAGMANLIGRVVA